MSSQNEIPEVSNLWEVLKSFFVVFAKLVVSGCVLLVWVEFSRICTVVGVVKVSLEVGIVT